MNVWVCFYKFILFIGCLIFLFSCIYKEDISQNMTVYNIKSLNENSNILEVDSTLYLKYPKEIDQSIGYLSELFLFDKSVKVKSIEFDKYQVGTIIKNKKHILVGLNPLLLSKDSIFGCKILLMDDSLNVISEKIYRYKDEKYTYIDTLYSTSNGYWGEIINISNTSNYYILYKVELDSNNVIIGSSKKIIDGKLWKKKTKN